MTQKSERRTTPGVEIRHSRGCSSRAGADCSCKPTFQANVWSARDGRRIRKTFASISEAKAWRVDALQGVRRGTMRAPSSTTVREEAQAWLEGVARGEIRTRAGRPYKPSVLRSYRVSLEKRIYPEIGARRLSDVTLLDLQQIADRLIAAGHDASTIRNAFVPLRSIYRHALKRGRVALNPAGGLDLPAVEGTRDRIADPAEAAALLDALDAWPSTASDVTLWASALYAGLRRGELQALRWEDVDLRAGKIRVERSWDEKEGPVEPKSKAGRRTVPIPAVLRRYLAAHELQARPREGLVFARTRGGPFVPSNVRKRALTAWAKANDAELERAELEGREARLLEPIGLHEARHTYASLMIAAGVNAKALTTYLGHSSIQITFDRYGHLMPGNEAEAASLLDTYLQQAEETVLRDSRATMRDSLSGSQRV
jgi:integrase